MLFMVEQMMANKLLLLLVTCLVRGDLRPRWLMGQPGRTVGAPTDDFTGLGSGSTYLKGEKSRPVTTCKCLRCTFFFIVALLAE